MKFEFETHCPAGPNKGNKCTANTTGCAVGQCMLRNVGVFILIDWQSRAEAAEAQVAELKQDAERRSPKDYAIEHAEYMAKAAERFLDAANTLRAIEAGEDVPELRTHQAADDCYTDHYRGLTEAIYEFRKRAVRAAKESGP